MKFKVSIIIAAVIAASSLQTGYGKGKVYYFYADNCSACREAQVFYKKPDVLKDGGTWTSNGITFTGYKIVDSNNRVLMNNINILNNLCASIEKRKGDARFVYFRRDIYEYYKNKGLPYYRKEEKYSRKNEAFPTPVFVIGDRVVLGFNQDLVQQAIAAEK